MFAQVILLHWYSMAEERELREDPPKPFKVAMSGSHGLIASYLIPLLTDPSCRIEGRPISVTRILRTSSLAAESERRNKDDKHEANDPPAIFNVAIPQDYREEDILWAPKENWIEAHKLEGFDAVIHLAGEPVAEKGDVSGQPAGIIFDDTNSEQNAYPSGITKKLYENEWMRALGSWNAAKKAEIHDSRVRTGRLLASAFCTLKDPPQHLFVASGRRECMKGSHLALL